MANHQIRAPTPGVRLLSRGFLALLFYACLFLSGIDTGHAAPVSEAAQSKGQTYDVVIYGSTPAALAAAIQTVRMKKTVVIVAPGAHIGGLTVSGLGWTDSKDGNAIGGIAREFFGRVYSHYTLASSWVSETRAQYVAKNIAAQPGPAVQEADKVQWTFEPHVAEAIWEYWMRSGKIPVYRNEPLVLSKSGVSKSGAKISSITTETGKVFKGSMFIDASYEGDLMAAAGIPFRIGRESDEDYDESLAGFTLINDTSYKGMDPYVKKGSSRSGLVFGLQRTIKNPKALAGTADPNRLQSYNYRLSLTKVANNKVAFTKPYGYDESNYELLFRYIESGYAGPFFTDQLMPNIKTDTNANGEVSTDLMGGNYDDVTSTNYLDYGYDQRNAVAEKHKTWAQGLFWTLANHPRVPKSIRTATSAWGYAQDEWTSNGNWPYEIYIRESRRMLGAYTVTQTDAQTARSYSDDAVVGLGSYSLDVHQVERVVVGGNIYNEGLVHEANPTPFAIPFKALVPAAKDATNLVNPVTLSSTHIAFAAIRMEPTYMILGQSAATAAVLALEGGVHIQDVNKSKLTARLKADSQILSL